MVSNAHSAEQLGKAFSYGGGSVGQGLTVSGEGAIGSSSNNKTIVVGNGSINLGVGPLPFSYQAGESWTYVWK
jgi:hypothetical protein